MDTPAIRLLSLNVGQPRLLVGASGQTFHSSIGRKPATGPLRCTLDGLEGDACKYPGHHGRQMALNAFDRQGYADLEEIFGVRFPVPGFGENLTLEGLPDSEARIGDVLRVGTVLAQVSQLREPCGNLVHFLGQPRIIKAMHRARRTGYYLRVLEEGEIAPGSPVELVERGDPRWTIEALGRALFLELPDEAQGEELMRHPQLSINFKRSLARQFQKLTKRPLAGAPQED